MYFGLMKINITVPMSEWIFVNTFYRRDWNYKYKKTNDTPITDEADHVYRLFHFFLADAAIVKLTSLDAMF